MLQCLPPPRQYLLSLTFDDRRVLCRWPEHRNSRTPQFLYAKEKKTPTNRALLCSSEIRENSNWQSFDRAAQLDSQNGTLWNVGGTPSEIDVAFAGLVKQLREHLVGLATRLGVPTVYPFREFAALTVSSAMEGISAPCAIGLYLSAHATDLSIRVRPLASADFTVKSVGTGSGSKTRNFR